MEITDNSFEQLKLMTSLTQLNLERTDVSDEMAKRLAKALPACLISRD